MLTPEYLSDTKMSALANMALAKVGEDEQDASFIATILINELVQ
jgi:hypothetical protein